ncbi:MAG: hypothetical protein ACI9PX_000573 [Reinekea sp.]
MDVNMGKCRNINRIVIIGVFLGALSACQVTDTPLDSGAAVDAGVDQTVNEGTLVSLSATATNIDMDSIVWVQVSGSKVVLANSSSAATKFTAPNILADETLVFEVTVTDTQSDSASDMVSIFIVAYVDQQPNLSSAWLINNSTNSTHISGDEGDILENIQSVETVTITDDETNTDVEYTHVKASGIPNYDITMTQDIIDQLNGRPKAATDFANGQTTAQAGEVISFGANIGYNSSTENCNASGGAGYWPPGPGCPTEQSLDAYFAVYPEALATNAEPCETGLGTVGVMVNGTTLFNWGDGQSYGDKLWYNLAPIAEQFDVDICGGHAANGNYHHHFYTSCLADILDDDGSEHSPIYGYAADGYPLYGPYEYANELAVSGWKTRDYGASNSAGGCATPGERSCVLVDQYDVAQGVKDVVNGPDVGQTITTQSNNTLVATDGFYFEDYYYAQESVGGTQLDEHNGHDTNDGKGYHYHITLTKGENGGLSPAFPYQIGPRFKGILPSNSVGRCSAGGGKLPPKKG